VAVKVWVDDKRNVAACSYTQGKMKIKFMVKLTNSVRVIPNVIATVVFVILASSCSTNNQMHSRKTNSARLNDSLLVDSDGNKYPTKILSDGNLWMIANLNLNIPGSYCYENVKGNCEQYGRLYLWESAQQGCKLLGEGWRLPDKDEWRRLTILYAGIAEDSNATRKGAYKALLYSGASGFNALLGGGRAPDGQYGRLDAHGFYWTATESDSSTARFCNFAKGSQALYQQNDGEKTRAFSVRCVKSIDKRSL
jgi:uncharacterized protein (TIGR02145 family)